MMFCRSCGAQIHETAPLCPNCGAPQEVALPDDLRRRTFGSSVSICFARYATFRGRAPRAEFWYFTLFGFLVQLAADIADPVTGTPVFSGIAALVLFLPSISVQVRRLHDLDRSGWWWWLLLIPVIGWIVMLVWDCTAGTPGRNSYGPDPLGAQLQPRYA